jgi:hypothetical protein
MKQFWILLILTFAASFAHADTINLLTGSSYTYSYTYTFPTGSYYNQYYGTGLGLLEGYVNYNSGAWSVAEAFSGTTVGNVTHFASGTMVNWNSYQYTQVYLSNPTFNARTSIFTATYVSGGKTWHLRETFGPQSPYYVNPGVYSYTVGGLTSAQITTVPEPGSLWLMGTGLVSLAGLARRKFLSI